MAKRFTDSEKWRDPWFRKLPADAKLVWLYLCDNCDVAGFWEIDVELMQFQIGTEIDWAMCVENIGDRFEFNEAGDLLRIVKFIEFQYGNLSENCPAHKPVFRIIDNRVSKGFGKGKSTLSNTHSIGIQIPTGNGKGKGNGTGNLEDRGVGKGEDSDSGELFVINGSNGWKKADHGHLMARVGKLFRRRASTKWSEKEIKALEKALPIDETDLAELEAFYGADLQEGEDFRRRNLETLLHNWAGEVDKARRWVRKHTQHEERYAKF